MTQKNLSIIIPSYNELNNLKSLLKSSNRIVKKNRKIEIIIVENGSTDGSYEYIVNNKKKFSYVKIVSVKHNLGYGHGIKYGLKFAKGNIVSWTHADLQFDIKDVVKFFLKNESKIKLKKIVVKGVRENRSFFDIFFTKGMSLIVNFFFNTKIYDINAQPKMFSQKIVKNVIKFGPDDFLIDLFLLLIVSKNGYAIKEFPLRVKKRFNDEAKGGGSFFGKIKLTLATLKYILSLKINYNKNKWKL